jgi:hypothetical protein
MVDRVACREHALHDLIFVGWRKNGVEICLCIVQKRSSVTILSFLPSENDYQCRISEVLPRAPSQIHGLARSAQLAHRFDATSDTRMALGLQRLKIAYKVGCNAPILAQEAS